MSKNSLSKGFEIIPEMEENEIMEEANVADGELDDESKVEGNLVLNF